MEPTGGAAIVVMQILDDLIAGLDGNAPVKDIRQGVFHTAVFTRCCGLAATLPRDALCQAPPMVNEPGSLLEKEPLQLVRMAYSDSILEAAIGVAAINSLIEVDLNACRERNAAEMILEKGKGRNVAIVGHFPFIPRIRKAAKTLWVIDKNPQEGDFSETDAVDLIPEAEVVAITGSALTNHTMPYLLGLCDPKAYVLALGDSVPMSPVLFDYGLNAVCGSLVVDPDLAMKCVSQGGNFRQIRGVMRLTMTR